MSGAPGEEYLTRADPRSEKTSVLTGTEALAVIPPRDEKAEPRSSQPHAGPAASDVDGVWSPPRGKAVASGSEVEAWM